MNKVIISVAISLAVIAAAVAAVWVSLNRSEAARAYEAAAEAEAAAKEASERQVKAEAAAKKEEANAAAAKKEAAREENEAQQKALEAAKQAAAAAADNKLAAEQEAVAAAAKADAAMAEREIQRAKADAANAEAAKVKQLAAAETSRAEAEAARLEIEKTKSERTIAEAKRLELLKIDFDELNQRLYEKQIELEERERVLQPEKTIADLSWAGGMDDSIIDENGNVKKEEKKVYRAEDDRELSTATRELARQNRLLDEEMAGRAETNRNEIIRPLEKLYVAAIRDDNAIAAAFYRKSIKLMYPDWKFTGENFKTNVTTKAESGELELGVEDEEKAKKPVEPVQPPAKDESAKSNDESVLGRLSEEVK